ncbi:uncharacterized protein LOC142635700 [Castanea sativa]|uniref:uncharacterized protein LOC142635700 n=1 Tax=Castanea sativa TaxID=21020 RepID=UPI003F653489
MSNLKLLIGRILFQPKEEVWEWRVFDLIDWQNHQWDRVRVQALFHQFDAEAILQVPLSRRVVQDSLVWLFTKNGRYSVKSGYHVAKQWRMVENSSGEASGHRASTSLWSCVWKAGVPNKERGAAQDVWAGSAIRFQNFGTEQVDFRQLVASLIPKLSLEERDLFWDHLSVPVSVHVPASQVWQPLQGEFFKLNFDRACFDNGATSSYGAVIPNGNGEVMAAISAKGGAVRDSEEVEVMACHKALEFAIDTGFMEVILEGDNALVMKTVSQAQPNFSRLGLIYEDIWCLAAGFRAISVSCVRRSANSVAHALTRFARLFDNEIVWMGEDPLPTVDALYLDSSLLI